MDFVQVEYGSARYKQLLRLREEVLRKPLGRTYSPEELAGDAGFFHFACLDGQGEVVGCVALIANEPEAMLLRFMAVSERARGSGAGARLLAGVEAFARGKGVRFIRLAARESAVGFYEKGGYCRTSERYDHIGLPHFKMEKELN